MEKVENLSLTISLERRTWSQIDPPVSYIPLIEKHNLLHKRENQNLKKDLFFFVSNLNMDRAHSKTWRLNPHSLNEQWKIVKL